MKCPILNTECVKSECAQQVTLDICIFPSLLCQFLLYFLESHLNQELLIIIVVQHKINFSHKEVAHCGAPQDENRRT